MNGIKITDQNMLQKSKLASLIEITSDRQSNQSLTITVCGK